MPNKLRAFVALTVLTLGGLSLGTRLDSQALAKSQDAYQSLEVFSQVLHRIRQDYVDAVDVDRLMLGAINGMVKTLDPFSQYMTPEQFRSFQEETSGEYFGIGVEITQENKGLKIVAPYPGSPAEKAGLKAGDLIVKIDGAAFSDIGPSEAVNRIKGRKGTKVLLGIQRADWKDVRDIPVERDQIHTPAVVAKNLEGGIGYVRVMQFQERVADDVQKAIKDLEGKTGSPLKGLVLDLRNNPGGLLDEAVEMADLFIEQGVIVSTKGRTEDEVKRARRSGTLPPFPMVLLINDGSASASEILAGALQDHKRATIVGEPSYGKGSVQNIIRLENEGALRLTVAKYYTPNGRPIDPKNSIIPDVFSAPSDEEQEAQLDESDGGAMILREQQVDPSKDMQLREGLAQLKKANSGEKSAPQQDARKP
ncbi:MAG: S41 family peptidase [Myxococcota bacterium]